MQNLLKRFLHYVQMDTQSDANSDTTPSTEKQWKLAKYLANELEEIGMQDVTLDENAYVMATLPANANGKNIPTIGFIAHFDTSPDFTAAHVKPQIIENYDGTDIWLNKEKNILLSPSYFPELLAHKGQTLITTDGNTLLGADDKAGIAEIVTAMEYLLSHPEIAHGKIRVGFTPDEEIGRGAHKFDVKKFGADWAYTMDGSEVGELEFENFNAAAATVTITGKSVHPGYAKDKMVNSMGLAHKFLSLLPENQVPEKTSGREGFFHLTSQNGSIEKTTLSFIIRDHDSRAFEEKKLFLKELTEKLNTAHGNFFSCQIEDQYFNMREKIEPVFHIVDIAEQAMKDLGIKPIIKPIRGGTDGAQLSFKGLPCPNIFAGGHNFHGKYEYVSLENMEKAVAVIVRIAELTAGR
ncbi:MAG: peptidase T [Bacteroidetes bacterium]|nr:peptidase T [Bacteroidota bacterium]